MSKPRKDKPLKMPRYRGGDEALNKFIQGQLKYPEEALSAKVEGEVKVSYDVDGLGRINNIQVTQSLGSGCDEEVKRLVKLLKFEKAFNKGRTVTIHKNLNVNFSLPKEPTKKVAISYTVTPSKKTEQKQPTKKISYKITY